jgi:hypothetical protein
VGASEVSNASDVERSGLHALLNTLEGRRVPRGKAHEEVRDHRRDLVQVVDIPGHAHVKTIRQYARLGLEDRRAALEDLASNRRPAAHPGGFRGNCQPAEVTSFHKLAYFDHRRKKHLTTNRDPPLVPLEWWWARRRGGADGAGRRHRRRGGDSPTEVTLKDPRVSQLRCRGGGDRVHRNCGLSASALGRCRSDRRSIHGSLIKP